MSWQPSASLPALQQRALLNHTIRQFFIERHVLEVDVPLLSLFGTTDPFIESLRSTLNHQEYYLQTSPEFFLKRFLAKYQQDVYYLGKAFRQGEVGRRHQPEFTLLEWYRVGQDEHFLMDEVKTLIHHFLPSLPWEKMTYRQAFEAYLRIDPHTASAQMLSECAHQQLDISTMVGVDHNDKNIWLDMLFTHCIEPHLTGIVGIYDYPHSQAALAQITVDETDQAVARRFEVFVDGVELANGYWELADAVEQKRRFLADQTYRDNHHLPPVPYDQHLVDALKCGRFPACSGVALGIDRLLMQILGETDIRSVISFPIA